MEWVSETDSGTEAGMKFGIGSGRSSEVSEMLSEMSEMSEELSSMIGDSCDVPDGISGTRMFGMAMTGLDTTSEGSRYSRKVTQLSAQLINRLYRVSQSSPRTAGNSISSLVNKNELFHKGTGQKYQ